MKNTIKRNEVKVSKSLRGIHVQLLEVDGQKTIQGKMYIFASGKIKPVEQAFKFGQEFSKVIASKKVKKISYDRGNSKYAGRIKAFAEGLRSGGIEF